MELKSEEAYTRRNIQRTEVVIASIRAPLGLADGKGEPRLRSLLDEQRGTRWPGALRTPDHLGGVEVQVRESGRLALVPRQARPSPAAAVICEA